MKFFLLFAVSCVLIENVLAVTFNHHHKHGLARVARAADDDDDTADADDAELEAALKRKPMKIRPAFATPKPMVTTEKPDPNEFKETSLISQPVATATARPVMQPAIESRPPAVDSARSFVEPQPLRPFVPVQPRQPSVQQPAAPLYTGFQGNQQFARPYQTESTAAAAAQWGVKGGRTGKGSGKSSAFWFGKGPSGQQQLQQQAIVKSPIARGKSMYRPRPQVPMVVAPLAQTDLQVPAAPPVENVFTPQQKAILRMLRPNFGVQRGQVNSFKQSQPEPSTYQASPAPSPAQVMPIARGSRPRAYSKSKYVDVNDYQQREQLNSSPVSPAQAQPALVRAAVSEQGAFALDDCPYGMRLSMCRLRAAQRLRS